VAFISKKWYLIPNNANTMTMVMRQITVLSQDGKRLMKQ
jgi:hypothetical protein